MKEIRIHGRGGHGSVATAELLAIAAFKNGLYSQAFPYLGGGGERRGAPVQAFCRISKEDIQLKCQIKEPDYLMVMDASLMDIINIFQGLKPGGTVLINSQKNPSELGISTDEFKVYTFPATQIALETMKRPIMNTAMIGAFAALTRMLDLPSLRYAVQSKFDGKNAENNIASMEKAFTLVKNLFSDEEVSYLSEEEVS